MAHVRSRDDAHERPCLDLIAGTYSAWTGAFVISATGERVAIVGRFDAPPSSRSEATT